MKIFRESPGHRSLLMRTGTWSCLLIALPSSAATTAFPPDESFDEVTAPALPPQWVSAQAGEGAGWTTVAIGAASSPNAAFTDDPSTVTDRPLETPTFHIVKAGGLTFRHTMDLDHSSTGSITFDGVVLEVAIGDAPFQDIFAAGGSFQSGGYDHVVFASSGNPLAGRPAWGGTVSDYVDVVANLPASADGQDVRVRWRMGTDGFESGVGYWLDDVHVDGVELPDDCLFREGFEGDFNDCV
jgi:hypothetical protein